MCVCVFARFHSVFLPFVDVDHRSPLRDNTNFTESTPKAVPAVVKPQDLYEMEWGEAPPLSPIERNLWSPEPSPDPSLPPSSQEQLPSSQEQPHPYYIAPEVKYDMPLRPHRRKKKKKEETKQQVRWQSYRGSLQVFLCIKKPTVPFWRVQNGFATYVRLMLIY